LWLIRYVSAVSPNIFDAVILLLSHAEFLVIYSGLFKESVDLSECRKRPREEVRAQMIHHRIELYGWEYKTWATYLYHLYTPGFLKCPFSDENSDDFLDLFGLADYVNDIGLVNQLTDLFERSITASNIIPRVFSAKYQPHYLAPLQQRFKRAFLDLWSNERSDENVALQDRTTKFISQLGSEETGGGDWTSANAGELFRHLTIEFLKRLSSQRAESTFWEEMAWAERRAIDLLGNITDGLIL
jgi:hypothetical protein